MSREVEGKRGQLLRRSAGSIASIVSVPSGSIEGA